MTNFLSILKWIQLHEILIVSRWMITILIALCHPPLESSNVVCLIAYWLCWQVSCLRKSKILKPKPASVAWHRIKSQRQSFGWSRVLLGISLRAAVHLRDSFGRAKAKCRASLVAQWLRIRLPMQGTWVLVREDPTCCGATKPVRHSYWACSPEPTSHNYWAHVPQLLKPVCLEPVLCNKRSHRNEKTVHCKEE